MSGWKPCTRRRNADGHGFRWTGGRFVDKHGYVRVLMSDHPHADPKGYVKEHLVIVCRALGRKLPPRAEVHHVNEDKADNVPPNLVLCPSRSYHCLLHQRTRALDGCGHASWRRCTFCKKWDAPENLLCKGTQQAWHRDCRSRDRRRKWAANHPVPSGKGFAAVNRRKTHCPKGHPLVGENLVKGDLARGCRTCRVCRNAQQYARNFPGEVRGAHWVARDRAILGSATDGGAA